jgi:hypothetical protein
MRQAPQRLLQHLERKHQTLDVELGLLLSQPRLTPHEYEHACELKKRKLIAKDEITALRQALSHD